MTHREDLTQIVNSAVDATERAHLLAMFAERLIVELEGGSARQAFLDAAAIAALPWALKRYPVDHEGPGFAARMAYNAAEALWAERERRVGR